MHESIVFNAAVKLPREQRPDFLEAACAGNPQLRAEVEGLLKEHDGAGSFLDRPAAPQPATEVFRPITEGPGTVIGPYKLLQQVGEGGFGVVYMAEQNKPVRRKVALKIIKPGMDTKEVIARFEAERQALALMDHPNIAKVFDAGATDTGRPYFVMELVKGVPLTNFCDENQLTTRQRLELFATVCLAIQHAHQKGIIHRDVKPSNVMVTIHDNKPVPKVIDFGVSKAISQQLTEKTLFTAYGQMVGTPTYMSPEQAQMSGMDVDTRSDIYSLGVLLFEVLTGSTPLDVERLRKSGYEEMQRLIREEEAPRPSQRMSTQTREALAKIAKCRAAEPDQLEKQLRGDLDWIVIKTLEKDRNRRYETANGLARDVQRYLAGEPVEACPPTLGYRFRKFAARHRAQVAVGSVLLATLLIGIVGTTFGLIRAERSRRLAETERAKVMEAQEKLTGALAKSRELQFKWILGKVQALTGEKNYSDALLWLARALELAPPDDADLQHYLRTNLDVLSSEIPVTQRTMPIKSKSLQPMALSPDGNTIATADQDPDNGQFEVQLWDADSATLLDTFVVGQTRITCLSFSPDSKQILVGSGTSNPPSGGISLWNTDTRILKAVPIPEGEVWNLAFAPDGKSFYTVNAIGITYGIGGMSRVQQWRASDCTPDEKSLSIEGHLYGFTLHPDGTMFVACAAKFGKSTLELWDARTFVSLGRSQDLAEGYANDLIMAYRPDGRQILMGQWTSHGGLTTLLDAQTLEPIGKPVTHANRVYRVAFSPNGQTFLTSTGDSTRRIGEVQMWDLVSREPLGTPMRLENVSNAIFSPKGRSIVTTTAGAPVRVWDLKGDHLQHIIREDGAVSSLAFSPNGSEIRMGTITSSQHGMYCIRSWDLATGRATSIRPPRISSHPA